MQLFFCRPILWLPRWLHAAIVKNWINGRGYIRFRMEESTPHVDPAISDGRSLRWRVDTASRYLTRSWRVVGVGSGIRDVLVGAEICG